MSRRHDAEPLADAMAAAIRFLAVRWRTSGELRRHLLRRGYSETVVEKVLEHCRERKYIDDAAYAEHFVRQRLAKGYGPRRLAQELARKGMASDVYRPLLSKREQQEWVQAAQQAAVKKLNQLPKDLSTPEKKTKIARHLQYKGFSPAVIHHVLDTLFH
ncbi:MAG: regulatory protein RecX [Bacillota bacterium]|nr:hypothetical protein [Bacillota bacterium]